MSLKKILLITITCFITYSTLGQKLYVWCPEQPVVKQRIGFLDNQEINIIIFDGRSLPPKSKIECQSEDITNAIFNVVRTAYPSAKINLLKESDYYKKPETGKITLKIGIVAYQAGFGVDVTVGVGNIGGNFSYGLISKSEWNGITGYYAQIFDNRNSEKKFVKEISKIESKSNIWGYKTAKTCLNTTFGEANQELLFFIDNSLME